MECLDCSCALDEKNPKHPNRCRNCYLIAMRKSKIKIAYGDAGLVQFERILSGQMCDVCGTNRYNRRLHVDHDHKTNKVRGILCHGCNTALGLLNEDIDSALNLVCYLLEAEGLFSQNSSTYSNEETEEFCEEDFQ